MPPATLPPSPFPSPASREASRRAKRDALLRAAVQMFNEQGFHQTSLDDVAARLGVSKPTIYHYLGNKDRVLLECVTIGLSQLVEAVATARSAPGPGANRLQVFLQGYGEVIMDDFGRCVIRTDETTLKPDSRERFRSFKRRIDGDMRALIGEGMADGSIVAGDVRLLAFTVAGALNWAARWHDPQGALAPAELARSMVALLSAGFLPRPPQG